jgi:predicted phosphodiesterase
MTGRLIAVGDIHGCHNEFEELLGQLDLKDGDRLVLLGDLVNRGPNSTRVIELARAAGAISLLGNHELRLLKFRKTGDRKFVREHDLETFEALRPEDWAYLEAMPLTFEEPELNTVFVHGGFLPNEPPWADLWGGPPFVVYGHTPRAEIYKLKWSIGIDTGCVLGGYLSAYILPERRIAQVKARQKYFP